MSILVWFSGSEVGVFNPSTVIWPVITSGNANRLIPNQDRGEIQIWNPFTDQLISTIEAQYSDTGLGLQLAFSSDNKFMGSFGSGKVYLWFLSPLKRLLNVDNIDPNLYGGGFNKDNSLLIYWDYDALSSDKITQLWGIQEGHNIT